MAVGLYPFLGLAGNSLFYWVLLFSQVKCSVQVNKNEARRIQEKMATHIRKGGDQECVLLEGAEPKISKLLNPTNSNNCN